MNQCVLLDANDWWLRASVDVKAICVRMLHGCKLLFGSEQLTNFTVLAIRCENYLLGQLLRGVYMAVCMDFCWKKILDLYLIFRSDLI